MITKQTPSFEKRYEAFLNDIRGQIRNSSIRAGDFLVSETKLAEIYQISKMSIRRGLAELEKEGLIEKIPSIGNRVKEPSAPPESGLRLRVYQYEMNTDQQVFEALCRLFEERNPGLQIELTTLPGINYIQNVAGLIEQGEMVDLLVLTDYHLHYLQGEGRTGLLESLPDEARKRDYFPQTLRMFESGKHLKAVPFSFSPVVYSYNADIVTDAERLQLNDWNDLRRFVSDYTVVDESGIHQQYGLSFHIAANRWTSFILQNGGAFYDDKGDPCFSDPEAVEALQFFADLVHEYRITPYSQGEFLGDQFLFENNKVAILLTSYYYMNHMHSLPFKWDVLPSLPGNGHKATILLGIGIAIGARSANKPIAMRFTDFLSTEEAQTILKTSVCSLPVNRAVAENRALTNPEIHPANYYAFLDLMDSSVSFNQLGVSHSILAEINRELTFLWANMETAEEACRRIERKWLDPVSIPPAIGKRSHPSSP